MTPPPPSEVALRAQIVRAGKLMYDKSLVVARDGNISARLGDDRLLVTPSGLCKGLMAPEQLIIVDLRGNRVDSPTEANKTLRPTSEISMHLEVYRRRPDVGAVVHAHPPCAIALSIAGVSLADCMLPEAIVFLGLVHTTPYATPSSQENAAAIRTLIANHDAIVLQRHGSLVVGADPADAFFKTETLEQIARITVLLRSLGGGDPLPPEQVQKLLAQRQGMGATLPGEAEEFCAVCGACHPSNQTCRLPPFPAPDEGLVELITRRVMQTLSAGSSPPGAAS